jgi:tRNA pseudouridine32 synthase/23S rRNA pseudouridine746 synthase
MLFQLIHADDHLLILDKPAGLLAVPGRGLDKQGCLSARVQASYPEALIVHRLDMATSGLLLMAQNTESQRQLSIAFAQRQVSKRYVAVVAGELAPPATADGWGLIDLPIRVDWPNRPLRVIDPEHGKPSQTRWRVVETPPFHVGEDGGEGHSGESRNPEQSTHWTPASAGMTAQATTRLELEPITGRSHQLRVHLQALGHPILGDPLYAPPEIQALAKRLLLHANHLSFAHPATGEILSFESPVPF